MGLVVAWVTVINSSQRHINETKSVKDALIHEKALFRRVSASG